MKHFNLISLWLCLLHFLLQVADEGRKVRLVPKVLIDTVNGMVVSDGLKEADLERCEILHQDGLHFLSKELFDAIQ